MKHHSFFYIHLNDQTDLHVTIQWNIIHLFIFTEKEQTDLHLTIQWNVIHLFIFT